MELEKMKAALMAQGISEVMVDSMLKSLKPKKDPATARKAYFAGQSKSKKIDMAVEVTVICECCGNTYTETRVIKAINEDSPKEMKLPVSSCDNCPDYFRALTHEQLVSLALAAHNPIVRHSMPRTSSQVKLAKRLTPEEMLNFTVKHH